LTLTGFPAPTVTESGALPEGVTLDAATGLLSGTPAIGTGGTYTLTFTASNGVGSDATQTFTLTVDQAPAITSANNATFTTDAAGTFSLTLTGFPAPTVTEAMALPKGVTFDPTTGLLSGTPAVGTGGTYNLSFTASNGVGSDATLTFTLTVDQAPAITSANSATFTTGSAGSFSLKASGFPTPTFAEAGALPDGVTFDNGILSGTPAEGTGGSYALTLTASNGIGSAATQSFTLTVDQAPAITSNNNTLFVTGSNGSFTFTATGFPAPTFTENGALPNGVMFVNGTLSGVPSAASAGTYSIVITAANETGTDATQQFTLLIQTPNQLYVSAVYQDLLSRPVDATGLAFWSGQLDIGGARSTLINLIDHSAEYFATVIKPAYQEFRGRAADPSGLDFWINQMFGGLTDEQLEAVFIGSSEYYQHSGGTDKGWVDAMYQNLLGRKPDSQGEEFWVGRLSQGVSRSSVALGFAASTEREKQHVQADYLRFLGRSAGQSEVDYWVGQFGKGVTNEDIITGFISSDEYFGRHSKA
jgi:hypothetical protein